MTLYRLLAAFVLAFITVPAAAQTIAQANAVGRHVSVCGEMAGDVTFTELLLAMGLRSFSMHPSQIAPVKQRILRTDVGRLGRRLATVLESEDPQSVCAQWHDAPQALAAGAA